LNIRAELLRFALLRLWYFVYNIMVWNNWYWSSLS